MRTFDRVAFYQDSHAVPGYHYGRTLEFVIPGLTRNPVPLGAGFLDSRFRGNDDPTPLKFYATFRFTIGAPWGRAWEIY